MGSCNPITKLNDPTPTIGIVKTSHDAWSFCVPPQAFQTYAFFNIDWAVAPSVGRKLGYQPSQTVDAMVGISTVLQQCGGTAPISLQVVVACPFEVPGGPEQFLFTRRYVHRFSRHLVKMGNEPRSTTRGSRGGVG